ncbi:MAG: class IV adenylate cyclase, partial [Bacteroidota bacterium]
MQHLLVEIKARCSDPDKVRQYLLSHHAEFRGVDHQVDTYFKVAKGRLKLREGNIERSLIYYERPNQLEPKDSHVSLCKMETIPVGLKEVLSAAIETKVVVDKKREIYFIDNVKFHIDEVKGLGAFVEIEAIG